MIKSSAPASSQTAAEQNQVCPKGSRTFLEIPLISMRSAQDGRPGRPFSEIFMPWDRGKFGIADPLSEGRGHGDFDGQFSEARTQTIESIPYTTPVWHCQ